MNGLLGSRDLYVCESWQERFGPVKALELFHVVPFYFCESNLEISTAFVYYYFFLAFLGFLFQGVEDLVLVSVFPGFTFQIEFLLLIQPSLEESVIIFARVRESVISYER